MSETIYASYAASSNADQAVGALLDHGVAAEDISLIAPEGYHNDYPSDRHAKAGITTTTGADAAAGANKGAEIGLGIGILAGIASLAVPGFGLVVGGGALATAIAGAVGATAAGAVAGGAVGIMKDQGVPEHIITSYETALQEGGAIVAVSLPTADADEFTVRQILDKYNATDVSIFSAYHPATF